MGKGRGTVLVALIEVEKRRETCRGRIKPRSDFKKEHARDVGCEELLGVPCVRVLGRRSRRRMLEKLSTANA